jgi:DNA-binding beta-propeller fold protein YncE
MKLRLMGVLLVLVAGAMGQRLEHEIVLPEPNTGATHPSVLFYNPADTTLWVGARPDVLVLKPVTGEWVARIRITDQVADMCLNPVRNKVYIGDNYDTLTVVDGTTHNVVRRIGTGQYMLHLAYSAASDRVFFAGGDTFLGVLDCASDSVIGHVGANGRVQDICVNADGTKLYCATDAYANMQVIDCVADTVTKTFWTGTPSFHLLYNPLANKVYCAEAGDQDVAVIDAARDSLLRYISFDYNTSVLGFNPRENKVYCALQTTAMAVIDGATDSLLAQAYADGAVYSIACDSANNVVYGAVANNDYVDLVNGSNDGYMGHLPTGNYPVAACYVPAAGRVYVANQYDATITEAGGDPPRVLGTLVIGMEPLAVDWAGNVNRVYCADRSSGRLAVVDGSRDSVRAVLALPVGTRAVLAVQPENKVYCAGDWSVDSTALSVIVQPQDSLTRTLKLSGYFAAMTYDSASHKLLCLTRYPYQLLALDCRNDSLSWTAVPPGYPGAMALAPRQDRVFVSGNGSVAAFDVETGSLFATIQPTNEPGLLSYVPGHDLVAVAQQTGDSIVFISAASCSLAGAVSAVGGANAFAYNRRHDRLFCGSDGWGVAAIDCATLHVTMIPATWPCFALLLDTIADKLYSLSDTMIQVIDCNTSQLLECLSTRSGGGGLVWNPVNRRVYVSMPSESEILVFYDSTIAGIAEAPGDEVRTTRLPSIVRGVLEMPAGKPGQSTMGQSLVFLLDITGRKVLTLKPGLNDISHVAAGVYFVRGLGSGNRGQGTHKVVIQR